jgi:TolB protein
MMLSRPRTAGIAAAVFLVFLASGFGLRPGSGSVHAQELTACLQPSDCPPGLACSWGVCEDAMAASTRVLFQVSVLGIPDTALLAGTRWLRQHAADRLSLLMEATGFFSVKRQAGAFPVDTATLFAALHAGSAYVIAGELTAFDGYSGVLRVSVIDAALGVTVAGLGGDLAFSSATLDRGLERWVNDVVRHFTGRPGLLGVHIACVRKFEQGVKEIFILTYGSNDMTQVTFDRSLALLPTWTVDSRVAYTSFREGRPKTYIQGNDHPFTAYEGMNTGIEWSRDGSCAAATLSKDGNPEIYLLEGTTGEVRARLTDDQGIDTSPTFSPDGSRVAFVSDREGTPQLFVMNADGSGKERLTLDGVYNTAPDWHPYGPYIVYSGRDGNNFQVYLLNVDTRVIRQLTFGPGDCEDPDWSPDGRLIAFSWEKGRRRAIYVMNPDGSNPRRITGEDALYYSPAWEILQQP